MVTRKHLISIYFIYMGGIGTDPFSSPHFRHPAKLTLLSYVFRPNFCTLVRTVVAASDMTPSKLCLLGFLLCETPSPCLRVGPSGLFLTNRIQQK